ncbi:hypothetical protein [Alteromonas gilva]|uniref:Uncharacterized protein n=1 Tax=Alteromonas gilva TaxID=2987522 RepID=A0ABT5L7H9_9ALTE|nr:hypothetical protein [Alteromonas gilva]MDC8832828.1 hypothetical protein [Alteromonas gilva]
MKTVTYSITESEKEQLVNRADSITNRLLKAFTSNPDRYAFKTEEEALKRYLEMGAQEAMFERIEADGLARITKELDEYFTFADHAGDIYNPECNPDIPKDELKKQERRERARFNRQGVHYHSLFVMGVQEDSIAGFVGNDFYGSGYESDFYRTAVEKIQESYPEYIQAMRAALKI